MVKLARIEKINKAWVLMGSIAFLIIIAVLIISLLSMRRSDSGKVTGEIRIKSVTCESEELAYPFFDYDDSAKKTLKVTIAIGDEELRSLSLQYVLYYDDEDKIYESEAKNHAAMNLGYYKNGLESDAINATYSRLSNAMRFGIYQTADKLQDDEKQYFLLEGLTEYSAEAISKAYNEKGMNCKIIE